MNNVTLREQLNTLFNNMDQSEVLGFAYDHDLMDTHLMDYDDLEEFISTLDPAEAFRLGKMSTMYYSDEYFYLDGYANLKSCNNPIDEVIYISDIVDYVLCNFDRDDINELLDI